MSYVLNRYVGRIGEARGMFHALHREMYRLNTADLLQKWKDIRNADIIPHWSVMWSNADLPKLHVITKVRRI